MSLIFFVYFALFFLEEDGSIRDAVCLMNPIEINNNDSDAFYWAEIIKSPRVCIICLAGFYIN